ncbi:MAG TPA: D-arabinono-1,4-lactone oxidase [Thermoanaerobaculia bacterium]|jgi:L-gulonolactone oxidase|nr:D-arabinono-1,4-lactone oxidase [Thermoanaerobaculia bacterium]
MNASEPNPEAAPSSEDFEREILAALPAELRDGPRREELLGNVRALAEALVVAGDYFGRHQMYRDEEVRRVNEAAERIHAMDPEFSLSDIDHAAHDRLNAFFVNTHNMFYRFSGKADHEAKWDGTTWVNWNRMVQCRPAAFVAPEPPTDAVGDPAVYEPIRQIVRGATSMRVVAGGHAFNESASTGGDEERPVGTLLNLDRYRNWRRLDAAEARERYGVQGDAASRLVRVQAGMRFRDWNDAMWAEGLAMPLAGSTDTQSLGGLVASDLHGTGRARGFLAEQIYEVRMVRADGSLVTWTRTADGTGWTTDEPTPRSYAKLPVAGALGMLGVVVELVIALDAAFYLKKTSRFVGREEIEGDLEGLIARHDHINVFYPAGVPKLQTVQLNTLDRTEEKPSFGAYFTRLTGELSDHALSSFAPGLAFGIAEGSVESNPLLRQFNAMKPIVLPAPTAFSRRLYYLHDEVEYAFPRTVALPAIQTVLDFLAAEELHSVVELRFTPDCARSMIGPGNAANGHGGAIWFGLATAIGEHSRARILQVFEAFDRIMRPFGGRPHLGKQTAKNGQDMAALFGADWQTFSALRREWDPTNKFLPPDNPFLVKLFA